MIIMEKKMLNWKNVACAMRQKQNSVHIFNAKVKSQFRLFALDLLRYVQDFFRFKMPDAGINLYSLFFVVSKYSMYLF